MKPCCGRCETWSGHGNGQGTCKNAVLIEAITNKVNATNQDGKEPFSFKTKFYSCCGYFKQRK